MASNDRFYQLEFRNRPALWGDVGSAIRIAGLIVTGNGLTAGLALPGHGDLEIDQVLHPSLEEWSDFIRRSDDPEILVGSAKIFQRKLRYEISGAIQQRVWASDGFCCVYCKGIMGRVNLTIDHFLPLELGGANDDRNYVSSCRADNKKKGNQHPKEFCDSIDTGLYEHLVTYLKRRILI